MEARQERRVHLTYGAARQTRFVGLDACIAGGEPHAYLDLLSNSRAGLRLIAGRNPLQKRTMVLDQRLHDTGILVATSRCEIQDLRGFVVLPNSSFARDYDVIHLA